MGHGKKTTKATTLVAGVPPAESTKFEFDAEDFKPETGAPKSTYRGNGKRPLYAEIAGNDVVHLSWKWEGAHEDFPSEPWLRTVRMYYPFAKGGPLAVDEPRYENEKVACKRKAKALKARGIRYLVYNREMTWEQAERDINDGLVRDGSSKSA